MFKNVLLLFFSLLLSLALSEYLVYAQLVSVDIGDANKEPGSTEFKNGVYTIIGSGSDIWDNADGFRFAYTKVSGNFEAIVRQVSIELKHEWAKGGIHARQDIEPGAPNAQIIVTGGGGGGCQISWRSTRDGKSEEVLNAAPGPWKDDKCWLKLTREGDEFHGYISLDAKDWKDLKSTRVKMSDPILVGLAMCGMNQPGKGVYDNFAIIQNGKTIFPFAIESDKKLSTVWGYIKQNPAQ